jgi:hypothetical protein
MSVGSNMHESGGTTFKPWKGHRLSVLTLLVAFLGFPTVSVLFSFIPPNYHAISIADAAVSISRTECNKH